MLCAQAWSQKTTTVTLVSPNATNTEGCIVGVLADDNETATWNANNAIIMTQYKNEGKSVTLSYRDIRIYAYNSISFQPSEGITIQKIVATAVDKKYAADLGATKDNCTISRNDNLVTIKPTDGIKVITLKNNALSQILKFEVTYTSSSEINPDSPITASLSFDKQIVTAYLDNQESFVSPILTSVPADLSDISYSSSNESVATVDTSTGSITFVGVGTTTITASCPETTNHTAAEASYTLVVEENNPQPTSVEVAIVAQRGSTWYAATTTLSGSYKLNAVEVTVQNGKVIYNGNEDIIWTWNESNGLLTNKADDKKQLAVYTLETSTNVKYSSSDNVWKIDDNSGLVNLKTPERCLIFSSQSGFGNYKNSNLNKSVYSGAAQLLPIAATESVTTNQYGWATYAPSNKISIPCVSGVSFLYVDREGMGGGQNTVKTVELSAGTTIERGTGFLVWSENKNTTVTFSESAEAATKIDNALVGVTEQTSMEGVSGAYILTRKVIDGVERIGFFPCSGGSLAANRCYLLLQENKAPLFIAMPENNLSGISSTALTTTAGTVCRYNICGQRVGEDYRGIVVRGGRKLLNGKGRQ